VYNIEEYNYLCMEIINNEKDIENIDANIVRFVLLCILWIACGMCHLASYLDDVWDVAYIALSFFFLLYLILSIPIPIQHALLIKKKIKEIRSRFCHSLSRSQASH